MCVWEDSGVCLLYTAVVIGSALLGPKGILTLVVS